jgi:hypothetical protein
MSSNRDGSLPQTKQVEAGLLTGHPAVAVDFQPHGFTPLAPGILLHPHRSRPPLANSDRGRRLSESSGGKIWL